LKPFDEFKEEFKAKGKPKEPFMQAMNDIESFIENPDNFSALFEPKTPVQKKKLSTPKPKQKQDLEADFDSLKSDSSVPSSPSLTQQQQQQPQQKPQTASKKRSSSVRSNEKPKVEKVKAEKRKSTRESEQFDEDMDLEPPVSSPPPKKQRKSTQATTNISSPRNNESSLTETASSVIKSSPRKSDIISPTPGCVYGLIGIGIMGSSILQKLLATGHEVVICNRTPARCEQFAGQCTVVNTPREVFDQAHITFVCVSDCDAVKEVVCGVSGIITTDVVADKGVVMLSSIDCETSRSIQTALLLRGSIRYLEAQLQGSREQVKDSKLIVISAGEKSLYDDCKSCFDSFAKDTYYLSEDTEAAIKMNLILQSVAGVQLNALTEALSLADALQLQLRDILEIISLSNLNSEFINEKGNIILDEKYREPSMRVDTMQKDLKMAIEFGDSIEHPMPLVAASKEIFKSAKRMGMGQDDIAAVYFASNFNKYFYDLNYTGNGNI
jgi:3-hydroxyisobutyrate dehydrogenase-like beta-hydroxyacid dehydrogenase